MSKKKNKSAKKQAVATAITDENNVEAEAKVEPNLAAEQTQPQAENSSKVDKKEKNKVVEVKAKDVKKKKEKTKKPNKFVKSLKDTGGELKKVTWPKFKDVVKQTGIVLVVVLVFTLVIFGLDRLCAWLTGFLF